MCVRACVHACVCVCARDQCLKLWKYKVIGVFAVLQSNGQSKLYVEALYDYEATQDGDLGFRLGDKIEIIKDCKWELVGSQCALCVAHHITCCTYSRAVWVSVCCSGVLSCLSLTGANLRLYVQGVYVCTWP